ncbi:hypothetical protein F5X97DRAFT_344967 [Nemania serpens]|nr:hypothetical protein F5X97DRAFT_344967 [Nemania serpens]
MNTDSDSDYRAPDSEDDDESSNNAPAASPTHQTLPIRRKRRAETEAEAEGLVIAPAGPPPPARKRAKGDFNAAYLKLLNRDIQDAASGLVADPVSEDTQIGAVGWSAAERNLLFAALSRRGGEDEAEGAVSARIATKSEVEVQQYLALLETAAKRQRDSEEKGKGKGRRRREKGGALRPVDVPAAVEIGAECDGALEAAADALSSLQESYEVEVERKRWGPRWRVTAALARGVEESLHGGREERRAGEGDGEKERAQLTKAKKRERAKILDEMPFLELFCLENWIRLSDRVFMNSAASDGNWRSVSEGHEPPAIRATALAHFQGLVVGIVKRLLLAATYMAESRNRKNGFGDAPRRVKPIIRVEDVVAAASSLGMKRNSREFWARCARRLRLNVVNGEVREDDLSDQENEGVGMDSGEDIDGDGELGALDTEAEGIEGAEEDIEDSDEDDYEIMSYDEVEAALGYPAADTTRSRSKTPETTSESIADDSEEDTGDEGQGEHDPEENDDQHESDVRMEDQQEPPQAQGESDNDLDPVAIEQDLEEAMLSLVSTGATSSRQALKTRIRAEHRLERDAERLDSQASADAETRLWAVLRGDDDDGDSRPRRRKSRT